MNTEDRCSKWVQGWQCHNFRLPGSKYCALHERGTPLFWSTGKPRHSYKVVFWDHKEQPPWEEINEGLRRSLTLITPVETGQDCWAIVMTYQDWSRLEVDFAQKLFNHWMKGEGNG